MLKDGFVGGEVKAGRRDRFWGWNPIASRVQRSIEPGYIRILEPWTSERGLRAIECDSPVECFWCDGAETIALLPPGAPAGILEARAIRDLILLARHVPP